MNERRVHRFRHGDDELLVVSAPDRARPLPLTPSELEVARLAASGLSNRDIALRRGRSLRTIANQIAAVLQKLGLSSRAQLGALVLPDR
ncbi:MAG: helix-turn-helix transcriptional regulator [Myxococcota bacterium]